MGNLKNPNKQQLNTMRNYIALALIAASTSAVMLREDVVEAIATDISEATGAPVKEVKDQVKARIEGADGDVEKAVDEAKAEFDGEKKGRKGPKPEETEEAQKKGKGPKPEIIEEAQEGDDADADVEEKVEGLARKAENGEKPSDEDLADFEKAAKDAGADDEDVQRVKDAAESGDVEGLKEEGKKCKKGGKKGGKPEETEEAQKKGKGPKGGDDDDE